MIKDEMRVRLDCVLFGKLATAHAHTQAQGTSSEDEGVAQK